MAIVSGASRYQFIDQKLGLTSGPMLPPLGVLLWAPATVYAAKSSVMNGGFVYYSAAGGTSAAAVAVGPTPNGLTDNTVTWTLTGPATGPYWVDSAQQQELGYQAVARDFGPNNFGVAQLIYVAFNGTTVAGDFVVIDQYNQAAVQTNTGATYRGLVGVSMGAGAAGKYGWVMIFGTHDFANLGNGASVVGTIAYMSATAGRVLTTVSGTNGVPGVVIKVTGDAQNRGAAFLNWPSASGNP
jgi:hypothetical protein